MQTTPPKRSTGTGLILRAACLSILLLAILARAGNAAAPRQILARQDLPWTPPANLSGTAGRSSFPQIAAQPGGGDLWALWTEDTGDPLQEEVLLRRRLGTTAAWSTTVNLSLSPALDEGPALYQEESGALHVAWTRRSAISQSTDLLYRRWDGSAWLPEEVLHHNPALHPSPYGLFFVRGPDGALCLFLNLGSGVRHTCLRAGGWEDLTPWVYVFGMQGIGDIALGPDGLYHVAALGKNEFDRLGACDQWLNDAYHITTDGTTWGPLFNVAYTGTIAFDMALAFDRAGRLHFFWTDIHPACSLDSRQAAVYDRVLEAGAWAARQEVTVYNEDQAVEDMAVDLDPAGRLHVAWSEGVFDAAGVRSIGLGIHYRAWQDGQWGKEEVVYASPEENLNVDMALYLGSIPVLVWEEGPSTAEDVSFSQRGEPLRTFLPLVTRK